jgi:hypothetical protein
VASGGSVATSDRGNDGARRRRGAGLGRPRKGGRSGGGGVRGSRLQETREAGDGRLGAAAGRAQEPYFSCRKDRTDVTRRQEERTAGIGPIRLC